MLISDLERLAEISFNIGDSYVLEELNEFILDQIESNSDGIMLHDSIKKDIKRILKEGK